MVRKNDVFDIELDAEEQEIEDSLPDTWDQLAFSANQSAEAEFVKAAAANYSKKDTNINIRLIRHDVEGIRRIAAREGLPYQTLIASILHKYVAHHLGE